jgi:hypothetical protein
LQPDRLAEVFKGAADGMSARFLYAWPKRAQYQPLADNFDDVETKIVKALDKLTRLPERTPRGIRLTKQAVEVFEDFRRETEEKLRLLDGREREWVAKAPAQVLRLGGTLAYIDWAIAGGDEPRSIQSRYVTAAVDLVDGYFWPHARAALRQIGLSHRHADERRVLRWIAANQTRQVSREDIRRNALSQRRDADETQKVLEQLERAGWLRRISKPSGPTGGRPTIRWEINLRLWE